MNPWIPYGITFGLLLAVWLTCRVSEGPPAWWPVSWRRDTTPFWGELELERPDLFDKEV